MEGVRVAVEADLPEIRSLVADAYALYMPRIGRVAGPVLSDYAALVQQHAVHVLEDAHKIVGVLVVIEGEHGFLLDNVAVRPDAQGKGFGRRLLEYAETLGQRKGYEVLKLYTNEVMVENLALYGRLGYVETHRIEEDGYRRIYMKKRLV